ncbi:YSIRK signal domain/LPXTG anchor domain surface protein, partial [Streptococcus pneumoniae]
MFHNKQEKFSLRKYKDGRTDSKLIGATILATGVALSVGASPVFAAVSSNGTDTATVVSDTSKVASTSATTFTDDKNSKTVKVDAVLGKDVAEPTKANQNTGDVDGNDTVNFKTEATVNYKLESDKSLLKTETVEGEKGTVTTPYDKKGIAYDTDGKDYRESTVAKTGAEVTAETGKKDTVEANNKVYEYVRSEVEGADKATYEKTSFNNIEARVSPEGMHNKLGEIDYTKTTGKVYLVEETADGQYGKFVEANGVSSDEDAVAKWKAGQANAKDFTKENVTLQEGDTVLVMDKDTYAVGDNKKVTTTKKYRSPSFVVENENMTYSLVKFETETYMLDVKEDVSSEFYKAGADGVFGTADDEKVGEIDRLYKLNASEGDNIDYHQDYFKGKKKDNSELKNARPADILKNDYHFYYELLKYAEEKARDFGDEAGLAKVIAAKERLDNFIAEKSQNIDIGYIKKGDGSVEYGYNLENSFFDNDPERKSYKKDIENIIGDFTIKGENTTKEVNGIIEKTTISRRMFTFLTADSSEDYVAEYFNSEENKFQYAAIVTKENMKGELIETLVRDQEFNELTKKGTVTVEEDGTVTVVSPEESVEVKVYKGNTDEEIKGTNERYTITDNDDINFFSTKDITTHNETTYTTKEVITPIRAYKVMSEAKPVVTHYYREKITKEEAGEVTASKQGSVVIKYVTTDGKQLKSETDKDNVTLETKTIVSLYSGETKVGERTDVATVEQNYDTTPKQYPTLVDTDTGFTYEYVGLKQDSPAASGKVVEGTTEVVYEYRLVSEEEKTPSKSEVTKTGSVDVKHVV